MKQNQTTALIILALSTWTGCGKSAVAPAAPPAAAVQASSVRMGPPSFEPILSAWQGGDKASAVRMFLEADWKSRPLFAADTLPGLTEKQFAALPREEMESGSKELLEKSKSIREVVSAVLQSGRDAAAKQDVALARRHFIALQDCGEAFDGEETLGIFKLLGRAFKKQAATELGSLGP